MEAFAYINKDGQEMICQGTPFKYLDAVLKQEKLGNLPKGLYSSKDSIDTNEEWCNTWTYGYYNVPKLEGVIVPNGTLKKLGIEFKGKPIELL
jgi:hypothetical protein